MRLDQKDADSIVKTIRQLDPNASIHLFGSRIDDDSRGGDLDLLVLSSVLEYRDKLIIRSRLKELIGNRKIDLIITDIPQSAFEKHAYKNSIRI